MYILVANVGGGRYFVQDHKDGYFLNGLIENAMTFESKEGAWNVQQLFSDANRPVVAMHIDEVIPPKSKSVTN
jgi:hypothetical protein